MIYAHIGNCWSNRPELVVVNDEAELLRKLNIKFKCNANTLPELTATLKMNDFGHGSPGYWFKIITPIEIKES